VVTQDSMLFNMTIGENLRLRNKHASNKDLIDLIEEFELGTIFPNNIINLDYVINETSSNLSGGEKQRLALIREIVFNPSILILDEVTSALDHNSVMNVVRIIERLKRKMTIIIVTHQSEYLEIADYAYKIHEGRVSEISV
jgi:ABC-type bacteriocin/lantibiotic exporter with double-glycine peptidase domain